MKLLLDTHTFLWALADAPELSRTAANVFLEDDNACYLSLAAVWEMAIKVSLGKLRLAKALDDLLHEELPRQGIRLLPIRLEHVLAVQALPFHHRDPFDRLMVAQALAEQMAFVSRDAVLDVYGVRRIW